VTEPPSCAAVFVAPQARHHLLVLARTGGLDGILEAREGHLPLLLHMEGVGQKWAAQLAQGEAEPPQIQAGVPPGESRAGGKKKKPRQMSGSTPSHFSFLFLSFCPALTWRSHSGSGWEGFLQVRI